MNSSFLQSLPAPLRQASTLAMLASVGAHVAFFTGSTLISAQGEATPQKLRVVRLLPPPQTSLQQPPINPDGTLPVPALPPPVGSSFSGLPNLSADQDVQAFLNRTNKKPTPQIIQGSKPQQQQQKPKNKSTTNQPSLYDRLQKQRSKDQDVAVNNPLTDDSIVWGTSQDSQGNVAPNQVPNVGDAGPLDPPGPRRSSGLESDTTPGGGGPTPTPPAPSEADVKKALEELGGTQVAVASGLDWLTSISNQTGRVPLQKKITLKPDYPVKACDEKLEGEIKFGQYITAEGKPQNPSFFDSPNYAPLKLAMLEAIKARKIEKSDVGKALVFVSEFKYSEAVCMALKAKTKLSPTPTASPTPSASPKPSSSPTPSASPKSSSSPTPSASPKSSSSPTPSASPKSSSSPTPSTSPKPSSSPLSSDAPKLTP